MRIEYQDKHDPVHSTRRRNIKVKIWRGDKLLYTWTLQAGTGLLVEFDGYRLRIEEEHE